MTASATDLIGKLGIDRAFRYFANGLVVLLVVFVVMPFPAVSWITAINSGKDDCLNLALLLLVVATGLVSTTLQRTVLGRFVLYRIHELLLFGKPTIVSALMSDSKCGECCLAKLLYARPCKFLDARLRYTAWRRNPQLKLTGFTTEQLSAEIEKTSAGGGLRLAWQGLSFREWLRLQRKLREQWSLGHAEVDLAFIIGATWLSATTGAWYYDLPTSVEPCFHLAVGILIILAAAVADLRQHQYEHLMATLDPYAVQRPPIK